MAPVSFILPFVLLLLRPALVHGANDWNKPCFDGVCSWDLNDGSPASCGLTLTGSTNAISDITTAAGWDMLSCETRGTTTTVRVVCASEDEESTGCAHLEQGGSATNKVVRLPAGCGYAPFARVANLQTSENQTAPSSKQRRLHRRTDSSQVKELTLDIDWSSIPTSQNGAIQMYITGANVPGAENVHNTGASSVPARRRGRRGFSSRDVERRGFFSSALSDIGDAVSSVASDAETAVKDVAGDVKDVATRIASAAVSVATKAADAAESVASAVSSVDHFNETKTFELSPVSFNKEFVLVNKTFGCGDFTADLDINGNAVGNAQISIGLVAAGTLVPPKLSQFQAVIGGNADFDGQLNLKASVKGEFSTGAVNLIQPIGITPFEIPGIFTLGPSIQLTGQVNGDLDLSADVTGTISYSTKDLQIFFPPQSGQTSSANTNINNSPLKLSLSPDIEASGSVELHLTPTLQLGLNAFDNTVQADVFIDFDAALKLDASAQASTHISSGDGSAAQQAKDNASFEGSVDVSIPISFNAGAKGDFFDIFNADDTVPIFSHTFDIFSKTFGDASQKGKRGVGAGLSVPAAVDAPTTLIRERENLRLASRAALSSQYRRRGTVAVLGQRDDTGCPSEEFPDPQEVANTA